MSGKRIPLVDRFWAKVAKGSPEECWLWTGATANAGYGVLFSEGTVLRSHRISYDLHNGPIPDGRVICHKCDNPPCVNPNHLFVGTKADNNHDRDAKGRQVSKSGDDHYRVILSDEDVARIRAEYQPKYGRIAALGRKYGVKNSYIFDIVHNRCRSL